MFKRRDWKYVNQRSGQDIDSDSDSDSDSEASDGSQEVKERLISESESEKTSSENESDQDNDNQNESEEGSEEETFARTFDDFSDPDDDDEGTALDVIKAWESDDPLASKFKGIPLRCVACKSLLLNNIAYKQHVSSKKHLTKSKSWMAEQTRFRKGKTPATCILVAAVCDADGSLKVEDAETHEERASRIREQLATSEAATKAEKKAKKKAEVLAKKRHRSGVDEEDGGKKKRKRKGKKLGKNQRLLKRREAEIAAQEKAN
uniref:U1-type domain-containing protein n=1 Tax=Polytomella parva TaxID=51329 RepID=A0A7S0VD37_9CHLO|mmetsp:Transcript_34997/g.62928  ORF Transcript_34997/g.62928 Transcript_34997/m.62928 type:complete len:262 (+) Transcript_34997:91-876(+)